MTVLRSAALLSLLTLLAVAIGADRPAQPTQPRPPRIDPDYTDVVIPPNLAPLNFSVREPGTAFRVDIGSAGSDEWIEIGVFVGEDDDQEALYLERHHITMGEGEITVRVDREPERAARG